MPDSPAADKPGYSHTLNLPQTSFPMQAKLAQREPETLQRWEQEKLYEQVQRACAGRKPYRFVDGPPYANGDIHIGHAVNKTLKDIIVKTARLDGFDAPFVPGWDCHGLPIELQVEKKHGKVGRKLDAPAFRAKCREYAGEQVERQRHDFKRLGVLADWDHPYLTMRPNYEAEQLRVLARLVEQGHVVRGFKPVHWCLDCGSALAEAEVEYKDHESPAIDVRFAAADPADVSHRFGVTGDAPTMFTIWTTTPWTIPANQAISAHPELDYVLVAATFADGRAERWVVAEGLLETVAARCGFTFEVLAHAPGKVLEGARARHPIAELQRVVPIILGEHVTLEAGTGLVHTAPAHGADDYVVAQKYGVPTDTPLQSDGVFAPGAPVVGGLYVTKVDEPVLEALRAAGALACLQKLQHSYPHCWRHKTPLIFRATPQWFVSMDAHGLREKALKEIEATRWIPAWGENRIREMVKTRPDWCISRQRTWGVPMAVFIDRATQNLHPDTPAILRRVADAVEKGGLEAWFGTTAKDWLGSDADAYDQCTDTLDVWFDSGCSFQASIVSMHPEQLGADGIAPQADLFLEGSDQHRGWFQSSLLESVAMLGRAPYKSVLTHGFTVDEQGRKMSKSVGNVVAPQQVTKTLGADILRLWVAASDYSGEIAISDQLLKRIADAYRRIRNTARYLLGNLHDFEPATHAVAPDALLDIDAWAIARAAEVQERIIAAYRDSQFHLVYQQLHNYCVVDLGGLYLDVLKDRLYTLPENSLARRSGQTALWHIAEALVRWITPILSFTADEIWPLLPGDRSTPVFAQTWHTLPTVTLRWDTTTWATLLAVREAVKRELEARRNAGDIGGALDADLTLYADGATRTALEQAGDELRFWFITSAATVQPAAMQPADVTAMRLEDGTALGIAVERSIASKCARCWQHRSDVGSHADHPDLCGRCVTNIAGSGEQRHHI
ncbi:MAG: isoleucine--tRNA ligase [Nevskiaceae bacterium]|nr:MAG: isoleucine--tRNA ligase [Nevskiaceae bacterium]TBR74868.1 MAG: isoleucine--tRNA ligase [Nevskiaceae bacterium]